MIIHQYCFDARRKLKIVNMMPTVITTIAMIPASLGRAEAVPLT